MDQKEISVGIYFIIYGQRSYLECERCITTIKKHMPDISIAAIVEERLKPTFNLDVDTVQFINLPPKWDWRIKVDCIRKFPFEKTLFLDTDTIVCDDITDVFSLLDRVDMAICHEPVRTWGYEFPDLPDSFPMLNSGVIAYRHSKSMERMFKLWGDYHDKLEEIRKLHPKVSYGDQNSLRPALYYSTGLTFSILPPEYNCRVAAGCVAGKVRILHAHGDLLKLEQIINSTNNIRLHGSYRGKVFFVADKKTVKFKISPSGVYK